MFEDLGVLGSGRAQVNVAFGCLIEELKVHADGGTTLEEGRDNEVRSLTSCLHFFDCIFISSGYGYMNDCEEILRFPFEITP